MDYLFGKKGLRALEKLVKEKTIYAFDFDGTLVPLADRPEKAKMSELTSALLRELCEVAPTAIVSGRAVRDLRRLIPISVPYLVGNHGLEGILSHAALGVRAKAIVRRWRKQLPRFAPSIFVEDKKFSLSLHYRDSSSHRESREKLLGACSSLNPAPRVIGGKCVLNLMPTDKVNKGRAIKALMTLASAKRAIYVGDDATDEDVFQLFNNNSLKILVLTVRVGMKKQSKAQFFIKRQSEINKLLRFLITHEVSGG